MKNLKTLLAIGLMFLTLPACGSGGAGESGVQADSGSEPTENTDPLEGFELVEKTYIKSDEDIANPGRGFYKHTETLTSFFVPLDREELISNRHFYQPAGASYSVNATTVLRAFILDAYIDNAVLSEDTLNSIQSDFDTAREAGVKLVLRFYYHKNTTVPYGDPEKETMLAHIDQLRPLLTNNADVILAVQQGFIGAWGEQYYSDNFSPAAGVAASYTDQNWTDRNEILSALLAATSASTMVQVRIPQAKQKLIYGIDAPIDSGLYGTEGSLSSERAFSDEYIARVGFHNDCFLTDASDTGTYSDYGTAGGNRVGDAVEVIKYYHKNDSRFVVVGGETCADQSWATPPVPFSNDCSDDIVNTMDQLNYTYLSADYNNDVNNDWAEAGNACIDEVKKGLGYRLAATMLITAAEARAGNYVPVSMAVDNDGFTSPVTRMELRLILKQQATGAETTIILDAERNDLRRWQQGTNLIAEYVKLPNDLPTGTYDLWLHIADISNSGRVASRPEYSIQLANIGLWDPATGYNSLQQSIQVTAFFDDDPKNIEPSVHLNDPED